MLRKVALCDKLIPPTRRFAPHPNLHSAPRRLALLESANASAKKFKSLKKAVLNERDLGRRREEELIRSVVELEGTVRKMKREKKVLVQEVRRVGDERDRIVFEVKSELEEKNLNLRVAERRIRKLSGEEEGGGRKAAAMAKVDAQLEQLRAKLRTLRERKDREEGVEGGGVDVLINEVSDAITLLEQHKTIVEGGGKKASALNFKS